MRQFKLTLRRKAIYARTQPEAGHVTTKVVDLHSGNPGNGVVSWKVGRSNSNPTGRKVARWGQGGHISCRTAMYEVLDMEEIR